MGSKWRLGSDKDKLEGHARRLRTNLDKLRRDLAVVEADYVTAITSRAGKKRLAELQQGINDIEDEIRETGELLEEVTYAIRHGFNHTLVATRRDELAEAAEPLPERTAHALGVALALCDLPTFPVGLVHDVVTVVRRGRRGVEAVKVRESAPDQLLRDFLTAVRVAGAAAGELLEAFKEDRELHRLETGRLEVENPAPPLSIRIGSALTSIAHEAGRMVHSMDLQGDRWPERKAPQLLTDAEQRAMRDERERRKPRRPKPPPRPRLGATLQPGSMEYWMKESRRREEALRDMPLKGGR